MTQYQSTPDFYREYIEHGWLKDAAKAVHKYIKRWRNAAGKWVYQYKDSKTEDSNLRDRGFSGSRGSGESKQLINYGTRNSRKTIMNALGSGTINGHTYKINHEMRRREYSEWRKNPQRYTAKYAIKNRSVLGSTDAHSANKPYKRGKALNKYKSSRTGGEGISSSSKSLIRDSSSQGRQLRVAKANYRKSKNNLSNRGYYDSKSRSSDRGLDSSEKYLITPKKGKEAVVRRRTRLNRARRRAQRTTFIRNNIK